MSIRLPNGKEINLWDVKFVEPDWKAPADREVVEVADPYTVEKYARELEDLAVRLEQDAEDRHGDRALAQRARSHARSEMRTRLVKVEVR